MDAARAAGQLDEAGEPILPEGIVDGDTLVPRRVKIGPGIKVYALNRSGINYVRMYEGYNNPTEEI